MTRYGRKTALVRSCMPPSIGSMDPWGRPERPSLEKAAKAAAQARSRLKMPSRPGCTTGAKGKPSKGEISQKFKERSRTSTHVAASSCVASGPGRIPLLKKTMLTYATHAAAGTALSGSAMIFDATLKSARDAEPGLKGAGSGTSKPDTSRPLARSTLYMEQPRVKGRGWPSFSTCHCTPTNSPPSATSSRQNWNVSGRASATLKRCFSRASFPMKAPAYCVSSYSQSSLKTAQAAAMSRLFHALK